MELGVDIAQLNVVNMRNVPPTPANYAQRSGRAGRSGQPALVFTYCTTGSPHDQYFFKRPQQMVAGRGHAAAARPGQRGPGARPRPCRLAGRDRPGPWARRSRTCSTWPARPRPWRCCPRCRPPCRQATPGPRQKRGRGWSASSPAWQDELQQAGWYTPDWLDAHPGAGRGRASTGPATAGATCTARRSAQREVQNKIIGDASRSPQRQGAGQAAARRGRGADGAADRQSQAGIQSDFYSYRYFASEGFLPGYNFPRLPLSAYIPGRRLGKNATRRVSQPAALPGDLRVRPAQHHLPRGLALRGQQGHPARATCRSDHGLVTTSAKLCPAAATCTRCRRARPTRTAASSAMRCWTRRCTTLIRMQNVSTRRRDRINSDEEERTRMGYELQHRGALRSVAPAGTRPRAWPRSHGADGSRAAAADLRPCRHPLAHQHGLAPAQARQASHGFVLDTERGYWARNEEAVEDDPEDPMSASEQRVVPYVEDHRNCLLIEPVDCADDRGDGLAPAGAQERHPGAVPTGGRRAGCGAAAHAGRPAPDPALRGGRGRRRRPAAAARRSGRDRARWPAWRCELCHFDPETGDDLRRAPNAREDCEAACYDCLMSYTTSPTTGCSTGSRCGTSCSSWPQGAVNASPVGLPRPEHVARLKALCDSDLERDWLDFVDQHNLRLPDKAQQRIRPATRCPTSSTASSAGDLRRRLSTIPSRTSWRRTATSPSLAWDAGLHGDPLWRQGQLARHRAAPRLVVRSRPMSFAVSFCSEPVNELCRWFSRQSPRP